MPTNTDLTREQAVRLVRQQPVPCPACGQALLAPRYRHKQQNTEYRCPACGTVYHPCKLL